MTGTGVTGNTSGGDITSAADLQALLRVFYREAFADPLIGPFFTDVAGTDLEAHLPHITAFWETSLLRTGEYRRNAFAVHARLDAQRPLTAEHFGRWVQLWQAAVDGRHAGPVADRAKELGQRIAVSMLRRLAGREADKELTAGPGFVPLAALQLRGGGPAGE